MNRSRWAGTFVVCLLLSSWSAAQPPPSGQPPGLPPPRVENSPSDEDVLKAANVATDGPGLLDYFRKRTLDTDPDKIKALIRQLGDDSYQIRENASTRLLALGTVAVPALCQATKDTDQEVVRRAEDCLRQIDSGTAAPVAAAAVRLVGAQACRSG